MRVECFLGGLLGRFGLRLSLESIGSTGVLGFLLWFGDAGLEEFRILGHQALQGLGFLRRLGLKGLLRFLRLRI